MNILHTEASNNWGGQEIRILREAEAMRQKGHTVVIATERNGQLAKEAQLKGFVVYELSFKKKAALLTIASLFKIFKRHRIDLVNTHSSLDAWIAGVAARLYRIPILRTRHLSTPVRPGINSRLLYKHLTDGVVTTCQIAADAIQRQAGISICHSVPTGIEPFMVDPQEVLEFRRQLKVEPHHILIGTACIVRSWKGIRDLMQAADRLRGDPRLKWVVVGGGYIEQHRDFIDLSGILTFTGHLSPPFAAIAAMDIFALVSTAHEGVSQALLQAAYLARPLIATRVGGSPEVCLDEKTGILVDPASPNQIAEAVKRLANDPSLRQNMGERAHRLVKERFLFSKTLEGMEATITAIKGKRHDSCSQ